MTLNEQEIRSLLETILSKDTALMRCVYSAKDIKRTVMRIKSGEVDLDQSLIDIEREVDFIIRQVEQSDGERS